MKQFILVFLGGGLGSGLRYIVSKYANGLIQTIPLGTLAVNVLGSFIIGVLLALVTKNNALTESQALLAATGFCGGFTTFSAFAFENYQMLKTGDITHFVFYTLISLALGLLAVFLGITLIK